MSWQGKILKVDLTRGTIVQESLNQDWANDYIGERGLGSKYLWEHMDPTVNPMGPDNVLIFATGPLTGTSASTSGRYAVLTKGPLTGAIACSNSGGKFGAELKYAGYDLLLVQGKSEKPVYLLIEGDEASLQPADKIWGSSVWETEEWIKQSRNNPLLKIASIGIAGERGVRYAAIVNDLHRAAGRSGVGAVMGSKNLKAVAVRGSVGVKVKDAKRFMAAAASMKQTLAKSFGGMTKYGTNEMMDTMQEFGGLPTRNFQEVQFEGYDKIDARAMLKTDQMGHRNLVTNKACFGCTIACGRIAHIRKDHFTVINRKEYWHASGGLEYETAYAFGPVVGVDDLDACTFAGYLMNEHGMDPISFGVTLAAAMELYEMGVITKDDTDEVELKFGNAEALTIMAEKTGKQEGFGEILGLGSKLMCEKYGHPELSMTVKGQEFAGYDSRALQGMGLGYATGNRGACHLKHDTFDVDMEDQSGAGKAEPCKTSQDWAAAVDSSGLCVFTSGLGAEMFAALLDADSEGDWTAERLMVSGERIWNLERLFNLAAGLTGSDDTLPERLLKDPAPSGTAKGRVNELDRMLPEYYQLRGWSEDGRPTAQTLERLGLG
ncbi:MAG: aldehyde ferredoxin oxidoreductase family protein [Arenicellales bacterium]|jgi:aldehyde:ferredoxin oxidoreductase|nr:aldehyde ferredoxin oxidoreductase family protein [Arenicellales bacterium]HCV19903.1 aldehyde ferredoxin oxidoreductase [Gammaproteobacteria bacterium]MDP6313374.1 aldehyde ferredoxin oxidoreductase family protein [Arenicellales bacterium]MDP7120496.1 aldehyde ferredoxin oxidoreductase family protein [Arenicellales bacterium]MDP7192363.1 aldehyde ferredoxin oxidoreductase family protein [Arenicellales bacterium]|tara:strand:- start:2506 stop:4320 length:1815 start_codon:yes stop_codon:yes gene_type:complete